jgi:DEAD/DEAH box helicase
MSQTIQQTIRELHASLKDYIEATYHISAAPLIALRQELLERPEVIFQIPYLESTPRYKLGHKFSDLQGLSPAALQAFAVLTSSEEGLPKILYDPPYRHQSEAIEYGLIARKNLLVMTGTGSGKTESFLLPILGKLACEAEARPTAFAKPAMRALLLYPMNALVNDQLGRLRTLFGDPRLLRLFHHWAGRPPRFARYTSRTPYAGIRDARKKDHRKLKAFEDFYVDIQRLARGPESEQQQQAAALMRQLKEKGKWPAKPDLVAWFGEKNTSWQDDKTGMFLRAVTLPEDSELLTRHEVQTAPPDLLITNYSMLEYMLMRPIERPIFDKTRAWLADNPNENFLIVVDEAHLYRGAAGAEVGLLLRRLRDRLDIPASRFQIICATASFTDREYGRLFGAQLSGAAAETFEPITGALDLKPDAAPGTDAEAELLAAIDLESFYDSAEDHERRAFVESFLASRKIGPSSNLEGDLHDALVGFAPLNLLINRTMKQALPIDGLGREMFPTAKALTADRAVTALMALASLAKIDSKGSGLLPCRIHNFFRGLPGLWTCLDPACSAILPEHRNPICGTMYSQPREQCSCGRVSSNSTPAAPAAQPMRGLMPTISIVPEPCGRTPAARFTSRKPTPQPFSLLICSLKRRAIWRLSKRRPLISKPGGSIPMSWDRACAMFICAEIASQYPRTRMAIPQQILTCAANLSPAPAAARRPGSGAPTSKTTKPKAISHSRRLSRSRFRFSPHQPRKQAALRRCAAAKSLSSPIHARSLRGLPLTCKCIRHETRCGR